MVAPVVLVTLLLNVYPLLLGMGMSLYQFDLMLPQRPFVGLDNYAALMRDQRFWTAAGNTVWFALLGIPTGICLGLGVALLLNGRTPLRGTLRACVMIPWVVPPPVAASIWLWMFSTTFSPINDLLLKVGLIGQPIAFLGNLNTLGPFSLPMVSVMVVRVWEGFPFAAVMFLAGLQAIPPSLYEAASIDGATARQRFTSITLPMLRPVFQLIITLNAIGAIGHFNLNYIMTKGGPQDLTNVVGVYLYLTSFELYKLGYGSAIAGALLVVTGTLAAWYIVRTLRTFEEARA
jgi:multiple sugar transport system permease protein